MGNSFENLVYSKDDVIRFPAGIPGFENNKEFIIVQIPEYSPFEWLVCIDGTKLKFAIINPMLFQPDYSPKIQKDQLEELEIEKIEDVLLYTIVTIRENPEDSTANLLGPVIINKTRKTGKQIVLEDSKYSTKEKMIRKK